MIDPSISLNVKPIQIQDPLETFGKVQNLMNLRQQQQIHAQQLEAGGVQLQQQRQAMADDQAGRALFAGVKPGDPMPDDPTIFSKLGPTHGAAIVKSLREADKAHADLKKTRGEVAVQEQDYAGGLASMVRAAEYSPEAVRLAIQHAHQAGYEQQAQQLQQLLLPENQGKIKPLMDSLIQQSPAQQKLINEGRTATGAELRGQAAANADQRASELQPDQRRRVAAETQTAEDKAAGRSPIQPEEQARLDLQQRSQEQVLTHNRATEANATALLRVAQGRLGLESQHAEIAKNIYEQTYGAGANPALVGVEPKLRVQASTHAQKAADEYTKAMESAANVQSFIDLTKKGNKAAGSNLPIMGAESIQALNGIKRINRTEIEQYQGAGSLLDKIQGRIGKLVSGQPIPADVLKDIEDLHKTLAGNAAGNYNTKLGGINQNYRSNFQPVKVAGHEGGGGKITVVAPDGSAHPFDTEDQAKAFEAMVSSGGGKSHRN